MTFHFNYQSSFLLFFFLQGLVFAFLLLKKGREHNHQASRWLSLFVFLCCLYLCPWMFGHSNWYAMDGYREFLFFMPFQQLFLIGPVIYFYAQSLLDPSYRFQRKDWWHFGPALLYLLYSLVIFVVDHLVLDEYYFYADGRDKDLAPWYQISGLASMILYVSLSIRYYNQYRRRIFEELSYADTVLFNWIRRFLITLLAILTLRILFLIFLPEWGSFGTKFWYYLLFAVLAYYIALMGYTQVLESVVPLRLLALKPKEPPLPEAKAEPPANPSPILPDLDKGKTQVRSLMEEQRLYENPTLTLTDLAGALGITTKQTSALVNQGFGMNFNDFVNHYRVEAVKERLARGEHEKFTLLGIALACGFNSKSTFNRVFKRDTSLTPGQYLAQLEKRSAKS